MTHPGRLADIASVGTASLLALLTVCSPNGLAQQVGGTGIPVSHTWELVPSGLAVGDQFRLLFVSSTTRNARAPDIARYDSHVVSAASVGHIALRPYADHFRVLGSTGTVAARDHTGTTYTSTERGVPIYWVGGSKVADDYHDFYTGGWDSNLPTNESGESAGSPEVFTGSRSDGTKAVSNRNLGRSSGPVRYGEPSVSGSELNRSQKSSAQHLGFYGLSAVFEVVPALSVSPTEVGEGNSGATADLEFEVTLDPAASGPVTVEYADAASGTATSGVDYEAVTAGTLTFPAGTTSKTITVTVTGDNVDEPDETVLLRLSNPIGAAPSSGGATLEIEGTIFDDDHPVGEQVPPAWGQVPAGLQPGNKFRLLFVTSGSREAGRRTTISEFDSFVRAAAGNGPASLRLFSGHFRALASTRDVDARKHTETSHSDFYQGLPVYWLGGGKVADHYADLYDGDWDLNEPRNEKGRAIGLNSSVLTGSKSDGTKADGSQFLGQGSSGVVREGRPGKSGKELDNSARTRISAARMYGISGVFTVVAAGSATLQPVSAAVDGVSLVLVYGEDLDPDFVPSLDDFAVSVAGEDRSITTLTLSAGEVSLTLARAVGPGESVTASYTPGTRQARNPMGVLAGAFTALSVDNNTPRIMSVSAPIVREEGAGEMATLDFEVSLSGSGTQPVTVDYADATTGTATSGVDYGAISPGTLTFTGSTSLLTVSVTVNGDSVYEGDETVVLEFSGLNGAELADRGTTLEVSGTIGDDDHPTGEQVPSTWGQLPAGLQPGDKFRLLFVTSNSRKAGAQIDIDSYDSFVQDVALNGPASLRPFGTHFWALASTRAVSARDHTETAYSDFYQGLPVYWLGGGKVADHYADLYDGDWDSNEPRNENGKAIALDVSVLTGSLSDGTGAGSQILGRGSALNVREGRPGSSGKELNNGFRGRSSAARMYGLSGVFTVVPAGLATLQPVSAAVDEAALILVYGEDLDPDFVPSPEDFAVSVAGQDRSVTSLTLAGKEVRLTLASAVVAGEPVTASYTPGARQARNPRGDVAGAFAALSVDNDTPRVMSVSPPIVREGGADETATLDFEVSLSGSGTQTVTVDYADATTGTATSGVDYDAISAGTLTFTGSTSSLTVSVTVNGDSVYEGNETIVLEFSDLNGAELADQGTTLEVSGTIGDDDHPAGEQVPPTWGQVPSGLQPGDKFRLLFVTSKSRKAGAQIDIDSYDNFVQDAALNGPASLQPFGAHFRALASTQAVSARDHTETANSEFYQGLPIYWLGGGKVADDYADLFDGDWDLNEPRNENGKAIRLDASVLTGSLSDGTRAGSQFLGRGSDLNVREGRPGSSGKELNNGSRGRSSAARMYGLSGVFTVVPAGSATLQPVSATVDEAALVLVYGEDLDPDFVPSPEDFAVSVAGQDRSVASLTLAGQEVRLALASAVVAGESVIASYTPGARQARNPMGVVAGAFTALSAVNDTPRVMSVSAPIVREGEAGKAAALEFEVSLSGSGTQTVTVDYADATTGTATSGVDYDAISPGSLTFTGSTSSLTVSVTVTGDSMHEGDETVVLELSGVSGAALDGRGTTLEAVGTIGDDDHPVGVPVPSTWTLVPAGLLPGAKFRLLFVTSDRADAQAQGSATYDSRVQTVAGQGRPALRPYSSIFRVLGSTATLDARVHTETVPTTFYRGLPIYWVGGAKVADDYGDFYDGDWDSNDPTNELGPEEAGTVGVFTGSARDGTQHPSGYHLGGTRVALGNPNARGKELDSDVDVTTDSNRRLYGLSNVFTVVEPGESTVELVSALVNRDRVMITFAEEMDSAMVPLLAFFHVYLHEGTSRSRIKTSEISISGKEVSLTLERPVTVGGTYYVDYSGSYYPDVPVRQLRTARGAVVARFYHELQNDTLPVLSVSAPGVGEGNSGTTAALEFEITLDTSASVPVTVDYSDSSSGGATSAVDYEALTAGTLTFPVGTKSKTVRVTVAGDNTYERDERVVLRLSNPSGAALSSGGSILDAEGTIFNDDHPPGKKVPPTWGQVPAGLQPGEKFRLLFVTSKTRRAGAGIGISAFDSFVQNAAQEGSASLQPFSSHFRALASTRDVDARDHTETFHSDFYKGVPIYWLGGGKLADHYADLYDGDWDLNEPRNEKGKASKLDISVLTGSKSDGTKAGGSQFLGQGSLLNVREGRPGSSGKELDYGFRGRGSAARVYGLSGVFTVVPAGSVTLQVVSATVSHAELTLVVEEDLDPDKVPSPEDFAVVVDGAAAAVSAVAVSGRTVTLTLASAAPIGGKVTVSYTAGTTPLRTLQGKLAADFPQTVVTNDTLPVLSVSAPTVIEGAAGGNAVLAFEVTLDAASGEEVRVDYADSETGTATSGSDYQALAAGTLRFAPNETAKTVSVAVIGDALEEVDETVVLELGNAVNAGLQGGGATLRSTGTIKDDEAPAAGNVPVTWGLTPADLVPGNKFRLLFVNSGRDTVGGRNIALYDNRVRGAASRGRAALRPFSSGFRALASTADDDARDHTVTIYAGTELGVPIYWVGGARVADDYRDFYDGEWASNEARNQRGIAFAEDIEVFTGSNSDGTKAAGQYLGHVGGKVRGGSPQKAKRELSDPDLLLDSKVKNHMYGLSAVFTVTGAPAGKLALVSAEVDGAELRLIYGEDLDPDEVPAAGDFAVVVDGAAAAVSAVAVSGRAVTLTLASAAPIGGKVTVSYTAGTTPLRTLQGKLAADFPQTVVTNDTLPVLSVSAPTVIEGAAGGNAVLAFEVTLDAASGEEVRVDYADSETGTATSGSDYQALAAGTLRFAPNETAKTVSVAVIGDALEEVDETVVLELGNAVNAGLQGGGATLRSTGTIKDDEAPVAGNVPVTWGLTPADLVPGNKFRLLFVNSGRDTVGGRNIGLYDNRVRGAVSRGRAALRPFSSGFRALASTADDDARDHTVTIYAGTELGVPIYWVGGARVADDYRDFYDGEWASNEARNQRGIAFAEDIEVFTGSNSDGTKAAGQYLGHVGGKVRGGSPQKAKRELSDPDLLLDSKVKNHMYGLSAVFTVTGAPAGKLALVSAEVDGAELRLIYGEDLDPDEVPAAGDFAVVVDGAAAAVSAVAVSGRAVTLTLASAAPIGGKVTVSYTAGTTPLRTLQGKLAADFPQTVVTNDTLPVLSVSAPTVIEGAAGGNAVLAFEVTLDAASGEEVRVDYADSETGTATSGSDYQALAAGTLRFAPNETAKTVSVAVIGDALEEVDETVVLELGNAVNAGLQGGGATLRSTGTIKDDEAPAAGNVPVTWGLTPADLVPGNKFRLLFVNSGRDTVGGRNIALYDNRVRGAVSRGRAALRPFSSGFRALASTADDDARDHTVTIYAGTELGVPIYWVGGARVADDYRDFYDGEWASNEARNQRGIAFAEDIEVFTGSNSDGTKAAGQHLGHVGGRVRGGSPRKAKRELSDPDLLLDSKVKNRMYGLSGVFTVTEAPASKLALGSAEVDGAELRLAYGEDLDPDEVPAPGNFAVIVDGAAVAVTAVAVSGRTATLTLASAAPIGGAVTVSYTAGTTPLRTLQGKLAADFPATAVTNDTQPVLSVSAPTVIEGAAGGLAALAFEVTLNIASGEEVRVDYADSRAGTATSGSDYQALIAGTLTFSPNETSKTVSVAVIGDTLEEGDETVVLELRNAVNARLEGGDPTLRTTGTIKDDEEPVAGNVPVTWRLTPADLVPGSRFRLLFVTSGTTNAKRLNISTYDDFVRQEAADGLAALRHFSEHFRVLASTESDAARDHTLTLSSPLDRGVPIYWVGGARVADDYRDFYDGSWGSNEPRDQNGDPLAVDIVVFTGTESDGSRADSEYLGQRSAQVRGGSPGDPGSEVSDGDVLLNSKNPNHLYALSAVFTVVAAPTSKLELSSAEVNGAELTLSYVEDLDPDSRPSPADFEVTVAGSTVSVAKVSISRQAVTLKLADAVTVFDAVTASYSSGTNPLRTVLGQLAAGFSNVAVTNNTQPTVSINAPRTVEPDSGETAFLDFEVLLSPAADSVVALDYAVSEAGTAASGVDHQPLSGGTLTFSPGDTRQTVRVVVIGDERPETDETVVLELSNAVNATLKGGGTTLAGTGTIIDDEAPTAGEVPVTWGLAPVDLVAGNKFRLLLVTSSKRNARHAVIDVYDKHVRAAAASGREALEPFSAGFRALVSTESDDARDHTATSYTDSDLGVPIYWVGGAKVADDYRDLYDGDWDSNEPRDANGIAVPDDVVVFTGSESDGIAAGGLHLGQPDTEVRTGRPALSGSELSAGVGASKVSRSIYGLSGVFTLVGAPSTMLERVSAVVRSSGLTLRYASDLDPNYTPAPGNFEVVVDGVASTIVDVSIKRARLTLILAEPVPVGGIVTVSYTAGIRRMRSVLGVMVADFPLSAIENQTLALLSISPRRVAEGLPGEERFLDFEVSLQPAVAHEVTVDYADVSAEEGTATPGTDYQALTAGTLSFAPYETSRTVRVTVLGDALPEPHETVVLRLSGATNAAFASDRDTLDAQGTIGNDDLPIQEVASTWGLVPGDVAIGESFRLLFVTSYLQRGSFSRVARYDDHVTDASLSGMAAIRPYGEHFWALISTPDVDAREHTVTGFTATSPEIPIYWVNGDRVANGNRDFYDGSWASNSPSDEFGADSQAGVAVFTGSASDGSRDPGGRYPGNPEAGQVRLGKPHVRGSEIASQDAGVSKGSAPVYGLSGVFKVVPPNALVPLLLARVEDEHLTLEYGEKLDFDSVPDPGDFSVTVEGAPRAVTKVTISGSRITLRLASEAVLGELVTVSYVAGKHPLRDPTGRHVEALTEYLVHNLTERKLLVGETEAFEGDPLEFVATLLPASDQTVTVRYRTKSGTAIAGADFAETSGMLTFLPGQASQSFTVNTLQDDLDEPNETFTVILSDATNLVFANGRAKLAWAATILDDDGPTPLRVPPSWELVPADLADGDAFRLLFVSKKATNVATESIALYDRHVIEAAGNGDGALQPVSQFFWVLASVAGIDARDHTNTTYTEADHGIPIYWLGGDRVADNYKDFYDGDWSSNSPTDQFGERKPVGVEVFTGSNSDGTKDSDGRYLGSLVQRAVTVGKPGARGLEMNTEDRRLKTAKRPLYGLSGVFIVDEYADVPAQSSGALEINPTSVSEGSVAVEVTVKLKLARPARTDQEWELLVQEDTALSPEDFSVTPSVVMLSMAAGDAVAEGTFEISTVDEPNGIPECAESLTVRAQRSGSPSTANGSASARLVVTDPEADDVFCGPPKERSAVVLRPTGGRNIVETPLDPVPEAPDAGPPERLGTTARFAIWTDRTGYQVGQQVRLYRSVEPMQDGGSYTFFYYLENTLSGVRSYFAPGIRSTVLEPEVVDQHGMGKGTFVAGSFERAAQDLIWAGTAPAGGSWQFVAEVRSADATQVVTASYAKFAVSPGIPEQIGTPGAPTSLTGQQIWTRDAIYRLRGTVRVETGATLTIEAGTVILALGPEAKIVVERGAKIEAEGTRRNPVVMTCDAPVGSRERGCWGGLTVLGSAPANRTDAGRGGLYGEPQWEYGGEAPDDSSGTLRFVRVEFAGGASRGGAWPSPALGLYGVGSGTRVEYLQVHSGLGDGIAFRGGTVSCRYCVSSGSSGDLMSWSEGWQGTAQHVFLRQGMTGRHGIHAHGSADGSVGRPAIFNATLVGGASLRVFRAGGDALRLSGGAALTGGNWVVSGFHGLAINATESEQVWNGSNSVRNMILHRNGGGSGSEQIVPHVRPSIDYRDINPSLRNARYELNPDPRPAHGSIALDGRAVGASPPIVGHWENAPYAGAFGMWNWTEEWTFFGREYDLRAVSLPVVSIEAASAAEGTAIEFPVILDRASAHKVTVRYQTSSGSAIEGLDFTRSAGILTFAPGQTAQTITVLTDDDEIAEDAEQFQILLTDPTQAILSARAKTLQRTGTIYRNDILPLEVPSTWRLAPDGVQAGESFRLLFVSSEATDASERGISTYDRRVRRAAATGHSSIRPYKSHFRALGSSEEVDARTHTISTHESETGDLGVPIYWVGGDRVADDYRDFYDGSWASNSPTDEYGLSVDRKVEVFTGSARDGSSNPRGRVLGSLEFPAVRIGRPGKPGQELDAAKNRAKTSEARLYALSDVFSVARVRGLSLLPVSARVLERNLTLVYEEALDRSLRPDLLDFRVTVDGAERQVSAVTVRASAVALRLESAVRAGESVRVSYAVPPHRPRRLRSASGRLVSSLSDRPVLNETPLFLSFAGSVVAEGDRPGASVIEFLLLLEAPSSKNVTVKYTDTGTGTATSGVDYNPLADRTLVFKPGQVSKTVRVRVVGDEILEPSETVVLRLRGAKNATLSGGGPTLDAVGTIRNDDARTVEVLSTWSLVPEDLGVGESFRLMFVSSVGTDAVSEDISVYDEHLRKAARRGLAAIRPYSAHFQVLGSTGAVDARENTLTIDSGAGTGMVPIYWLGGSRLADEHADLYDGDWDPGTPRNQFGLATEPGLEVFTGSASDGTRDTEGRYLGAQQIYKVRVGKPHESGLELDSGHARDKKRVFGLYGLSGVFKVVAPSQSMLIPDSLAVERAKLTLTYGEALDTGSVPSPNNFRVTVDGNAASVSDVRVSAFEVTLTLENHVRAGQAISLSYTPADVPVRSAVGLHATPLSEQSVRNITPRSLFISSPSVVEGNSGATSMLEFEVTLDVPSGQPVAVKYADSEGGTATPGSDYQALAEETLVFGPSQRSKTITVPVHGDGLEERDESVVLRLSGAANAVLAGGGTELDGTGRILDDDFRFVDVASSWELIPEDLGVGDWFRLLFVSSPVRNAKPQAISSYDEHVRAAAARGRAAVRPYSSQFRVLGSTAQVAALDHTATFDTERNPGIPIYWLGGARVADNYSDFYDGSWLSNEPRNEFGETPDTDIEVFTGSSSDGTRDADRRHLGAQEFAAVRTGTPGKSGHEMSSGKIRSKTLELPLYGLSAVFRVVATSKARPASSAVMVERAQPRLAHTNVPDSVPYPEDFKVTSADLVSAGDRPGHEAVRKAHPRPSPTLGTSARFAIWTDETVYAQGEPVRLFRTIDPMDDDEAHTFFYYLENIATGRRYYFRPGESALSLKESVVDEFGMGEGAHMSRRFDIAEKDLTWHGMTPKEGSWQFVAEVRSADAVRLVKIAHAKFKVWSAGPVMISATDGREVISADQVWSSGKVYKLRGPLHVQSGATLAIEAGTQVRGLGPDARIIVERGGQIEVRGTREEPVVLTCDAPVGRRMPGCWGGLTILGRAPAVRAGEDFVRLPWEARLDYGGEVPSDSSGTLRFLRVEFAGGGSSASPALALYGIGSGTAIEHVQVHESLGTGIELRGGEARMDFIVSSGARGSALTWSQGWQGKVRHLFLQLRSEGGHGIVATGVGNQAILQGVPTICHATLIKSVVLGSARRSGNGIRLGSKADLVADGLIITGFDGSAISAGGDGGESFVNGRSSMRSAILHGNGGLYGVAQVEESVAPYIEFADVSPALLSARYERNLDPRPRSGSLALSGGPSESGCSEQDSEGQRAAYKGAFGHWNWTEEWTLFGDEADHAVDPIHTLSREGVRQSAPPSGSAAGSRRQSPHSSDHCCGATAPSAAGISAAGAASPASFAAETAGISVPEAEVFGADRMPRPPPIRPGSTGNSGKETARR